MLILHDHNILAVILLPDELKTIRDFNLIYFNAYHYTLSLCTRRTDWKIYLIII